MPGLTKVAAHIDRKPPTLAQRGLSAPDALEAALARALAKRADERFARAGELAADATAAITGWEPTGSLPRGRARVVRTLPQPAAALPAHGSPAARRGWAAVAGVWP